MKPMIVIPPDTMSDEDIKILRENGICIVVSKNPQALRFVDPIPAASSRTEIENTAIKFSRILLNRQWNTFFSTATDTLGSQNLSWIFSRILIESTALDARGSREEREAEIYETARFEEVRRIAREDARAEAAAKKAEKLKASEKK